ncbi:putative ABC transport system permease protein [Geodermatophilus amargosae]|uniref:Putative ABC transport system permease protein n=1 Tax=Geodermatophilus amargosae TaxID=1296565 RepID=A0A1I7CCU8_9ACTN|nr:ABC transporter permease [Geodermatophilus amargosae]SFT97236.1 putative ABC transport system permease protein [Geodermatophilus amargosae]
MLSTTLADLRAHLPRLVAATLAVVIAVAFVVATLVLNETSRATLLRAAGAEYVGTDVVVTTTDGSSLAGAADAVAAVPGVRAVDPTASADVQARFPGRSEAYLRVQSVAADPELRWQTVTAGALPDRPGEIAVATTTEAAVGDVVAVTVHDPATGEVTSTTDATVTGLVDLGGDPSAGLFARGFAVPDQVTSWGASEPTELRVAGWPRTEPELLAAAVAPALGFAAVEVRTGEQAAEDAVAGVTGNRLALAAVLLVFATVAVLVAGLVIANTLAVLVAQRTRDLALLRCVGATSRQVRRSVLVEAAATGLAASALGVGAGVGLAALVSALVGTDSPLPLEGVSVPLYAVGAGLAVGTLTTLLAALGPARAATRVAPLAALRPVDAAPLRSRSGLLRFAAGLLLVLGGAALMALGVLTADVHPSLAGGAASFLGVVLLAQRAVPPVVAAAGRALGRVGGVPGRMAAGNASRNPRRTAATATALLIGVTLTTAMVVGAASTRATAQAGLDAAYPADVEIGAYGELPASLLPRLEDVDGVAGGTALLGVDVTGPDGQPLWVQGVDAAAATPVLRSTADLPLPAFGEALLPQWAADGYGLRTGDTLDLRMGERSRALTVVVEDTDFGTPLLSAADLRSLAPDATPATLWLRLDDGTGQRDAIDEVTELTGAAAPDAYVTGLAGERAAIDSVLDALLLVVTGLLGVAVLIALIGVGNTLALSVVERRQENGLLRAMGLTRGQLRGLLAWEAVLVAGVAAVLGVLLGGAYGLIGTASVLGGQDAVLLDVPWLQVGGIVVVATVAGLLASVLPARRAARTAPVAAIAAG